MVDFIADEILAKRENYSKIHNGSMLLFPPTEKQDIFPSHPNAPFKSLTPISQKKEHKQRREEICTKKEFSEGFAEFKLVRLISPEDGRFPRIANNRAYHTSNKIDK